MNHNINQNIMARQVRLVNEAGDMVGIVDLTTALQSAKDVSLDLVEISPDADPPVCKLLDYKKFKYDQKKKAKEAAKKNRVNRVETKELWLRPVTDQNDIRIKTKHAKEFLDKGHHVKFTVKFRGRELSRKEQGVTLLTTIKADLGESITILQDIKDVGRNVTMVVSPTTKHGS